jgi:hypothetical protein
VQASPSEHAVPFGAGGLEHAPVEGLQLPASVHWLEAAQTTGFDPTQLPDSHWSVWAHALPSLQLVPFVAVGFEQTPVDESHVPATWHGSDAVHVTVVPAVHVPFWHVSSRSHALPSLQLVPFVAAGFEQTPVDGLHVPATWHGSDAVQTTPWQRLVPPTNDPRPSWYVTVAPEFIRTCAALSAPVNFDVLTCTSAFGATRSALIAAPEFRVMPFDVLR